MDLAAWETNTVIYPAVFSKFIPLTSLAAADLRIRQRNCRSLRAALWISMASNLGTKCTFNIVDAIYRQISRPIQWWRQETKIWWAKLSVWQVHECEPIVGVCGLSPQRVWGQNPGQRVGDEALLKLKAFQHSDVQRIGKMVQFEFWHERDYEKFIS